MYYYHTSLSFTDESPKLFKYVQHYPYFWQHCKKWLHQIISHDLVHMHVIWLTKNSSVRYILVQILSNFFFLTLTTKLRDLIWLSVCILPHLCSSTIQYHYASVLLISHITDSGRDCVNKSLPILKVSLEQMQTTLIQAKDWVILDQQWSGENKNWARRDSIYLWHNWFINFVLWV